MGRLDGKVAIISGGARGQGEVEARLFAMEGAKVVFGDILDEEGKQAEAAIRQAGGAATYVHLDVTQEADWQQAVAIAVSTYGKLDILVNNAGILRRDGIEGDDQGAMGHGASGERDRRVSGHQVRHSGNAQVGAAARSSTSRRFPAWWPSAGRPTTPPRAPCGCSLR